MLSTTTGGASQSPTTTATTTDAASTTSAAAVGVAATIGAKTTTTTVKVKSEPFSTLLPENATNQNQAMSDETGATAKSNTNNNNNNTNNNNSNNGNNNNSNNNSNKNPTNSNTSGPSVTPTDSRQNSSSSLNSPTNISNNSSNNASEHSSTNSNSSNNSNAESDLHQQEQDLLKKKNQKAGSTSIKEEDGGSSKLSSSGGNSSLEKGQGGQSQIGAAGNNPNINPNSNPNTKVSSVSGCGAVVSTVASVKDEPADLLSSLVNMKKEENFSPNMSPVGFGSIGGGGSSNAIDRAETPVKMELEKQPASVIDDIVGLDAERCMNETPTVTNHSNAACANNLGVSIGIGINVASPGVANNFMGNSSSSSNNNSGNNVGTCLDYMQQQNHIFVFSTQLANNGAESVLSGQFQTIIAYHCTQPATKSFLEDFFMKNPMKMNKLQRQNSLGMGICNNMSVAQNWPAASPNNNLNLNPNTNPNLTKMLQPPTQKSKTNHFNNPTDKRNAFIEATPNEVSVNESDLMCWETGNANPANRNSLETDGNDLGKCNSSSNNNNSNINNNSSSSNHSNNHDLSQDNNIISLQGVKVPDENLTPQQRQHREEQMAKLKKINQILFPENDKLPNDAAAAAAAAANMANIMMSGAGGAAAASAGQMRQLQLQQQLQHQAAAVAAAAQKTQENVHLTGENEVLLPSDVIAEMCGTKNSNSNNNNNNNNMTAASTTGTTTAGNVNMNLMSNNSPELIANFNNSNCVLNMDKEENALTPMEWTKIQQQFFEERLKVGKTVTACRGMPGPGPPSAGAAIAPPTTSSATASNPNPNMRNINVQGPPPPYHPTQRSASVPIATQSPNPSSPNNLSLPSPRTASAALGLPSNSPSMVELPTTSGAVAATASSSASSKSCFPNDCGSPSNRHHRGNNNNLLNHHLNSNPSTPLAHLSPKELDTFGANSTADLKITRPTSQRPRSPGNGNNNPNSNAGNHLLDASNLDARLPNSSPGLNFNAHAHLQGNPNTAMNHQYKGPNGNPMDVNRQNCGPVGPVVGGPPVQFGRRSDNMPLNPNSGVNRPPPNKMAQNFDPISSLAQMSQQLTSCVSGVGGNPAGGMNMMGPGPIDMNSMDHGGMMPNLDAAMEHMNNAPNNCHPINPLLNSMGQRMLNPKMGAGLPAGFSPLANGVVREGSGPVPGTGFHGILASPGPRMMGRMPVNFGPNFNPNIQVKASTPNTIQYMPVRPQNNNQNNNGNNNPNNNNNGNINNNGNVRMAPSLEFLQRYANPQMAGPHHDAAAAMMLGPGPGPGPGPGGPMNMSSPNEQQQQQQQQQKMNNGMNFFQNCNQLPGLDDDVSHELSLGAAAMVRGMRPHGMRQHGGLGIRMQGPGPGPGGNNLLNRQQQAQFSGGSVDGLDCSDPNVMFNNGAGSCNSSPPMFAQAAGPGQVSGPGQGPGPMSKPQHLKPMPGGGMCQVPVAPNVGMQGLAPGQLQQLQQPHPNVMGLPNNNNNNNNSNSNSNLGGNSGVGVNFVGPSSNDLKYAQQYHSFQQQLYATNTRSQQQQQQGGNNMIAMPPNLSPNPAFFVNK
ncbi:protein BCL9 homolog [Drosophila grimshawi]|uniref:GH24020 n=1 Tax=Drosophila grimshawi TaxID=7222 RepID=B4JZW7_DROGR|nr:protein BCL9 homolog [Drosophila grimshawi]EDV90983.1 GH24020 [Drosophila grimshawi]